MRTRVANSCLFAPMLAAAGLCTAVSARADDLNRPEEPAARARQALQAISTGQGNQPFADSFGSGWSSARVRVQPNPGPSIRQAAEAVNAAKGDDAKADAQKKLTELLNKAYDEDMVQREKELKQIEERLAKLRDLLERRRTKKQDIIDLQIKVALNEAQGLGFYDSQRPAKTNAFFYAPSGPPASGSSGSVSGELFVDPMPVPAPAPVPAPPVPSTPAAPTAPRAAAAVPQ